MLQERGSRGPGAYNCIWFVRLGGYINIMSALITAGTSGPSRSHWQQALAQAPGKEVSQPPLYITVHCSRTLLN